MILKTLRAKPLRACLTVLSIVIGVVSVLLINSVSSAGTDVIANELNSLGIDCISITAQSNGDFTLNNGDIKNISAIDGVKDVYAIYSHNGGIETEVNVGNVIYWGLSDAKNHILSVEVILGEFFNETDIAKGLPVCVIDKDTAVNYFGKEDVVGESVKAVFEETAVELLIIGVCGRNDGILSEVANGFIPEIVYMPSKLLQEIHNTDSLSQISVTMEDMSQKNINDGILEIKRMLIETHNSSGVNVDNLTENKNSIINIISMIRVLLMAIASISVVVACIGITNIMFISVAERQREIGIKKSIGATNFQIGYEFLLEGVTITIIGCILGVAITVALLYIANVLLPGYGFSVSVKAVFISILASIVLGSVFSIFPSIKAAKKNPVNCLKNE